MVVLVGVCGLGAGATAVFTQDVEAGPVALVAVGAFFFLIGIAGFLPTRLKIGENEAEFTEAVSDALDAVIDTVPPERRPHVEFALEELSKSAPVLADRARATLAREHVLMERVREAVARVGATLEAEPLFVPGGARPDAVVTGQNGRKVWVITHARQIKAWELAAARALLPSIRDLDENFAGIMVVAMARDASEQSRTIHADNGTVWITVVRKGKDSDDIDNALQTAFGA